MSFTVRVEHPSDDLIDDCMAMENVFDRKDREHEYNCLFIDYFYSSPLGRYILSLNLEYVDYEEVSHYPEEYGFKLEEQRLREMIKI